MSFTFVPATDFQDSSLWRLIMKLDTSVPASSHVFGRPGFDVNWALPECNADAWRMAQSGGSVTPSGPP
jgi:hypothetical protein